MIKDGAMPGKIFLFEEREMAVTVEDKLWLGTGSGAKWELLLPVAIRGRSFAGTRLG